MPDRDNHFYKTFSCKYSPIPQVCHFAVDYYVNNKAPALKISVAATGEPILTASVNLDKLPREDAIFIKSWSENEGVQNSLERLHLIGPPISHRVTGFVEATEHMMQAELLAAWRYVKERM